MLRTHPGFSTVAILALALGIGANTAVFTIVNGVLLRPLPLPEPDRLMLLAAAPPNARYATRLADRDYVALRRADHLFTGLASFDATGVDVAGAGEPVHLPAGNVTGDFFCVLSVEPVMGRGFVEADEGAPVAVIGASLWRERFAADPKIVGQSVRVDGVARTIVGVMPAGFDYPDGARLWTPIAIRPSEHIGFRRPVIGRLRSGASRRQAEAELQAALDATPPRGRVAVVQPFQELLVGDVRRPLLIFDAAVGFVLLIACANVANLLLIRTASRRQEIAVRGAVGASAARLLRQLLTESMVLGALGGAAGLLLAAWGAPLLLAFSPEGAIPRAAEVHMDARVFAFVAGVSLLTAALFGLAPMPAVLGQRLRDSLAAGARTAGRSRTGLRNGLAVAELALALVLLAGGGLMLKSSLRVHAVEPGFTPANALALNVSLPGAVYRTAHERLAFERQVIEKLSGVAGVEAVGAVDLAPLGGKTLQGHIKVERGNLPGDLIVEEPGASPRYFRAMGIRLLRGREFAESDDGAAQRVAVVSEGVARAAWPGQDPIGKRLSIESNPKPGDWLTVIGVVDDVRQRGPAQPPIPSVYRPLAQTPALAFGSEITFVVRTRIDPSLIAPAMLRGAVADVEKNQAVASIDTMSERVERSVADTVFQTHVLTAFAVMALLLAAVGIYGVVAYSVAERTREIGIRIALGAAAPEILRDVLGRVLTIAVAGVVLGTAGALAATRGLASLLFEVKPGDPLVFGAVAALLAAVAMLAGWAPARRATKVDPVVALRYE
jgi:putative ABC transport system permease protein